MQASLEASEEHAKEAERRSASLTAEVEVGRVRYQQLLRTGKPAPAGSAQYIGADSAGPDADDQDGRDYGVSGQEWDAAQRMLADERAASTQLRGQLQQLAGHYQEAVQRAAAAEATAQAAGSVRAPLRDTVAQWDSAILSPHFLRCGGPDALAGRGCSSILCDS